MRVVDLTSSFVPPFLHKDTFPDGQVSFTVQDQSYSAWEKETLVVYTSLTTPARIMELLLLLNALSHLPSPPRVILRIGYLYGGRSDRQFNGGGQSLPLQVIGDSLKQYRGMIDAVEILDPHSSVGMAEIPKAQTVFHRGIMSCLPSHPVIVIPDEGARGRVAAVFGKTPIPVLACVKTRDSEGRPIVHVPLSPDDDYSMRGRTPVIVDDICDGGGTFISIAKRLRAAGARDIELRVTHGIFSQGILPLAQAGITKIVTTNSFPSFGGDLSKAHFVPGVPVEIHDWKRGWGTDFVVKFI